MKVNSVENPEKNIYVLEIEADRDEFETARERAYRKNVGRISVPGFRKGKAPRKMIEKAYGEAVFYDDAVNELCPSFFQSAVEEKNLTPVNRPEIDVIAVSNDGFTFKAKFTAKPEFKVENYRGVSAKLDPVVVTDADIDDSVNSRREKSARIVTVEREAKSGDTVVIDYDGSVDGVPFDGGKDADYSLRLGSGTFIPGFEDQLIGKKAGDEVEVKVTFPEQYHEKTLAGKEAVFKVLVHEVKETVLPELDDEFAKDVSEFDTLEELRADIRKSLTESRELAAKNAFYDRVISKICDSIDEEVPEVMIESQVDGILRDFTYRLSSQGMTLENYLTLTGMSMDDFRGTFRAQAVRSVKARLMLESVAKTEGITVSDEDVENEYKTIAEGYKMEVSEIKKYIEADSIREDLLVSRAADVIRNSAVPEAEEEAAKEAAVE